jgi:parallel beta-helix repeat protein
MNNIIEKNDAYGLYLRSASNKNDIKENNIIQNNKIGILIENSNKNKIINNNIINNREHAYFHNSFFTLWYKNYWNLPRILPKLIRGTIGGLNSISWINVDLHPSLKQYTMPIG